MSDLSQIKVLYRQPDTGVLWGIPYMMRPGQQPGDLWRARQEYVPPAPGTYGSKPVDLSDWIYLGTGRGPTSSISAERYLEIARWLINHLGNIPVNPNEWTVLEGATS